MCEICEMPIGEVRRLPVFSILISRNAVQRARKNLKQFNLVRRKRNLFPFSFNRYLAHLLTAEIDKLAHAHNFDKAMRKAGVLPQDLATKKKRRTK